MPYYVVRNDNEGWRPVSEPLDDYVIAWMAAGACRAACPDRVYTVAADFVAPEDPKRHDRLLQRD